MPLLRSRRCRYWRSSLHLRSTLSQFDRHPYIFSLKGDITQGEPFRLLKSTFQTILLTTFALIITAGIQEATVGLDVYHALIVLGLVWINFMSASTTIFVFIVTRKVMRRQDHKKNDLKQDDTNQRRDNQKDLEKGNQSQESEQGEEEGVKQDRPEEINAFSDVFSLAGDNWMHATIVCSFIIGGVFGLCFWKRLSSWGNTNQRRCTPLLILSILGQSIPVTSPALRRASLAVYSLSIYPIFPLLVMLAAELAVAIPVMIIVFILDGTARLFLLCVKHCRKDHLGPPIEKARDNAIVPSWFNKIHRLFWFNGILVSIAAVILVVLITDIELTIRRNAHVVGSGEGSWSFGQTLAMVLLITPMTDLLKAFVKVSSWRARQSEIPQQDMKKDQATNDIDRDAAAQSPDRMASPIAED